MYKYHLADVKWKEMYFIDIFDNIYIAKSTDQNKLKVGNVPFIGRSSINNGLQGEYFVEKEKINKGNSLTISMVGEPKSFYQKYSFTCSQNILVLQNDEFINITNSKFLIPIIDNYLKAKGYGYGYPVGKERILRNKLLLPVDINDQINWHFMEEYIKERENKQRNDLKEYYMSRLLDLVICPEVLTDVEWGEFFVSDIFDTVQRGKRLTKVNQIDGETPYVSSTALNNGVDNFIGNTENIRKSDNDLTIANSGSVGACFYHNYEYIASDHVTSLKLTNENSTVYKFISVILGRLEEKYSFNREINDTRIKREKLLLPIDKNGNPNYAYMENFIKNIEQKQIKNVLKYLDEYIYIYIYNV